MSTINDRIGSQNVIRVLSNASAPPTRLNNLSDVNSTRKTEDGLVLVWDVTTEKFVLTDEIDAATLIISGITSFPNLTNSTSPLTGAVKISGGLGVNKNLNIGNELQVTGVSTFIGNINANGNLDVDGHTELDDLNVSGVGSFGSIFIGNTEVLSSSRQLKNILSLDAVTTSTIESAISNAPNTFTDLNVTGISTFIGIATFASGIVVESGISTFNNAIDAKSGILASTLIVTGQISGESLSISGETNSGTIKAGNLTAGRVVYVGSQGLLQDNANLTFNGSLLSLSGDANVTGTLTAGLIDGGSY